jgi:hypothetical protein
LRPLLVTGAAIVLGTLLIFTQFPLPFWNDLLSPVGLLYPGLFALAVLSFGLSRLNPRHGYAISVALVLAAGGIIAVLTAALGAGQIGSLDISGVVLPAIPWWMA